MPNRARIVDGTIDFSGGVDSGRVSTLASQSNPNGLKRNQLAWMTNCTARGGGVTQRYGFQDLGRVATSENAALYQGGYMYDPPFTDPYIVISISGKIFAIRVDEDNRVEQLNNAPDLENPPGLRRTFFCQGEEFLVIQAGDGVTLPLFWDGVSMRRSNGMFPMGGATRELPPATCMDYYMGRLWFAQNREFTAGDIVKGAAGTLPYSFRDSILKMTETPIVLGGDAFTLPTKAGIIRGITHTTELDTTLGEGRLYVGTRSTIFKVQVPVSRDEWSAAATKEPLITVAQSNYGFLNDMSIVPVNSDLFYQSMDGIRSLVLSTRNFQQWGNTPVSSNLNRLLQFNDRSLMRFCSGVLFDNRMLQAELPRNTPVGVGFQAVAPLDFNPLSSLSDKLPPVWEGIYEGYDWLQLFSGDFGGRERAFGLAYSYKTQDIRLVEITNYEQRDTNDNRVTWGFETPAYTWGNEFTLKELETMEIWVDRLYGTVRFEVEYRPDSDPCWHRWHQWIMCSARNTCEDVVNPICYPVHPYQESYRAMVQLPRPPADCAPTGRPTNIGYQFQFRFTIKGFCRVRGLLAHALPREVEAFGQHICYDAYTPPTNEVEAATETEDGEVTITEGET